MRLRGRRSRAADTDKVAQPECHRPDREPAVEARNTNTHPCADPVALVECRSSAHDFAVGVEATGPADRVEATGPADRVQATGPAVGVEATSPADRVECRAAEHLADIGVQSTRIHDTASTEAGSHVPSHLVDHHHHRHRHRDGYGQGDCDKCSGQSCEVSGVRLSDERDSYQRHGRS